MIYKYWKPFAVVVISLSIFLGGYASGVARVNAKWTAERLAQAEVDLAKQAENDRKLAEAEKKAATMSNKFRGLYASLTTNNCPAGDGVRAINQAVQLSR